MPNYYYTYVLLSLKDKKLYIGWTDDLIKRKRNHDKGFVEATKDRRPLKLIYYEACLSRHLAVKREKSLKTGYGRAYLKHRLKFNIPR